MTPPLLNISVVGPVLCVGTGAMAILMLEVILTRAKERAAEGEGITDFQIGGFIMVTAVLFLAAALFVSSVVFSAGTSEVFNPSHPMFQLDPYSALITVVITLAAMMSCALAHTYLMELHINHGEYYALLLLSTAGMMLLVSAIDLIAVFVGIELMSIPIYVLAGFDRRKLRSNESAIKYFLIGSFASAVLLYGMALLYGATGSTSFEALRAGIDPASPLAMIGLGLVIVGFAFKIASVPFHQWAPDVYEGAPTAVTAFMSVAVKTAAFAALLRLIVLGLGSPLENLTTIFWILAALTIVVGNFMAVIQDNIKRMLAYSSIAHAGYILIGFVAGGVEGYAAVIFYLIAYMLMNLGAFGVVVVLAHRGRDCERIESFAGLARSRPVLAALMTVFLVSLAGIPGTVGFIGKFTVFAAATRAGEVPLVIVGVLMSVVSLYYYLRVPVLMYMREPGEEAPRMQISTGEGLVLCVCAFGVLFLGIFPNEGWLPFIGPVGPPLLDWARESVSYFFTF